MFQITILSVSPVHVLVKPRWMEIDWKNNKYIQRPYIFMNRHNRRSHCFLTVKHFFFLSEYFYLLNSSYRVIRNNSMLLTQYIFEVLGISIYGFINMALCECVKVSDEVTHCLTQSGICTRSIGMCWDSSRRLSINWSLRLNLELWGWRDRKPLVLCDGTEPTCKNIKIQ